MTSKVDNTFMKLQYLTDATLEVLSLCNHTLTLYSKLFPRLPLKSLKSKLSLQLLSRKTKFKLKLNHLH